ncbi:MAG: hypothetical protein ACM3QZ_12495 [Solirubrobacterales bacterium]
MKLLFIVLLIVGAYYAVRQYSSENRFECDRCAWDHSSACRNPRRPNARNCPDFRPR